MQDDSLKNQVQVFRVGASETVTSRPAAWQPATNIHLFLIVSRFQTDHALTYLFCQGARDAWRVQQLVAQKPEQFRGDNAVVELGEQFSSLAHARQRALGLRTWLTNVNVVFPPVQLS